MHIIFVQCIQFINMPIDSCNKLSAFFFYLLTSPIPARFLPYIKYKSTHTCMGHVAQLSKVAIIKSA